MEFMTKRYENIIAELKDKNLEKFRTFDKTNVEIIQNSLLLSEKINENEIIPYAEWKNFIDQLDLKVNGHKNQVKLARKVRNDFKPSVKAVSQWMNYKERLEEKGFSSDSINEIKISAQSIVQQLDVDTQQNENGEAIKGLVVGNVQSGKTANMVGLISMAADYGFNLFIVFSGIIDKLREQTEKRLFNDLNLSDSHFNWSRISNPKENERELEYKWSNIDLNNNSDNRYFTVCLKNNSRMEHLKKWLYKSDIARSNLKVLIIDDEADQASINTNSIDIEEDKEVRTKINQHMLDIVNGYQGKKLKASNYVSYTATPFANVLNETSKDSLYPRDFIIQLNPSSDYIGPKQLFGLSEPEQDSDIEIISTIPDTDVESIKNIDLGIDSTIPRSLRDAIDWYFVASCALRVLDFKKPTSMLVHTDFRQINHQQMAESIKKYLLDQRKDISKYLEQLNKIYRRETLDFTRSNFIGHMDNYSEKEKILDYPNWEKVREEVLRVLEDDENYISSIKLDDKGNTKYTHGFHVVVDNSAPRYNAKDDMRLVYPENNQARWVPMFIIIGGNTLSRGLTLEGLITSYFTRTTKQADSLMQMGRWFGYRKGYELFPRIWLTAAIQEKFRFMAQMVEELNDEIKVMAQRGDSPLDYQPKIKYNPDLSILRITANNKMQSAEYAEVDYTGFNKQTVIFEDNKEKLTENIEHTKVFLNSLENFNDSKAKKGYLNWEGITFEKIKKFLQNFNFTEKENSFANINGLIEWCDDMNKSNNNIYAYWNVVLRSNANIPVYNKNSEKNSWDINGYCPKSITRTVKNRVKNTVNIGALRSPDDLYADIKEIDDVSKIELQSNENISHINVMNRVRNNFNYGKTPVIILYRIDKNSMPQKNTKRKPLNFSEDIIGMNILIPSSGRNTKEKIVSVRAKKIEMMEEN